MSQQLDHSTLNARNHLIIMFGVIAILDMVLVIISRDRWAIGRIFATILVMYCVLQGYKWAKWVLVSILSLVVVLLTAMLIVLSSRLSLLLIVGSALLIILNSIAIFYLIRSQDLNRYFAYKRRA